MKTFVLLLTLAASASAATVDDLAWLEGHWTGTGLGGQCTETWSPAQDGVMLGTFRLAKEGKPVFYEFMVLGVFDGKLAMRLKHFHGDVTGWEQPEKFVEFRHVRTDGNVIEFEGLRFVRDGADKMTIYVRLKSKDGTTREEPFPFTRQR